VPSSWQCLISWRRACKSGLVNCYPDKKINACNFQKSIEGFKWRNMKKKIKGTNLNNLNVCCINELHWEKKTVMT
jgi:hypothetical protein